MADEKISALPSASSVGSSDLVPIVQSGTTKSATISLFDITLGTTAIAPGTTVTTFTGISDPSNPKDVANKEYIDNAISNLTLTGSGVLTGCQVAWTGTGLQFIVSAGTYSINNTGYSVAQTTLTLGAADPTNPRIDLIIVDTTGTASVLAGTPAPAPVATTVDPSTQLSLTPSGIYVAANATTPGNIVTTLLFDENTGSPTEWNATSSGSGWTIGSTNNPYSGTHDIEATAVTTSAYVQLQKGSGTLDPSTQNQLVFYIRSKAAFAANRSITVSLLNGGVQYGNGVVLRDGAYGFSSSNTTSYQQIVIPIANFSIGANLINQARFTVSGTGGTVGFYLDLITFQAGISLASTNSMVYIGPWNTQSSYVKNNVVVSSNVDWIALQPTVNSKPSLQNSNWQCLSYGGDLIMTSGDINNPEILFGNDGTIMFHG